MLNRFEKIVKNHFGVTDDLAEAGYIISDGSLIDFSGRRYASGYIRKGDRFIAKRGPERIFGRNLDHRQLPTTKLRLESDSPSKAMFAFQEKTGAIRVKAGYGFSVVSMPSVEAVSSFVSAWRGVYSSDRPVIVDILDKEGYSVATEEIYSPTTESVIAFLESYLSGGPSMGARFKFRKGPKEWSPTGRIPRMPKMPISPEFVDAYLEAAIWSSMDESDESGGEPLDKNYSIQDFTPEAIAQAVEESNQFITDNKEILDRLGSYVQHGHDFWLTRNGHGAGFWDRGYGADGEILSEAAKEFVELNVYVADGKLHFG